jgi:hypothetical protein
MPLYRIFCLDGQTHIVDRYDIECADDESAIRFARGHFPKAACEVWELGRRVASLPTAA